MNNLYAIGLPDKKEKTKLLASYIQRTNGKATGTYLWRLS